MKIKPSVAALAAFVLMGGAAMTPHRRGCTGLGALYLLDQHRFDVIGSDSGMPGQDGYAFMAEVRRRTDARGGQQLDFRATSMSTNWSQW